MKRIIKSIIAYLFIAVNVISCNQPGQPERIMPIKAEETIMSEFTVEPVPEKDFYFSNGDKVFGFGMDGVMEELGTFRNFRIVEGVIYFTAMEFIEDSDPVEHIYSQKSGTVKEIKTLPAVEKDYYVLSADPYRVEKETYDGEPISAVYFEDKREPFHMVSGAVIIDKGLLINIDDGRGPARPAGLWLWSDKDKPPVRLGGPGWLW